jgi:hypothetical protein
VREWITRQLSVEGAAPVVVIDHGSVVTVDEIEAALGPVMVCVVTDWFELRREWERSGRRPDVGAPRLVMVTADTAIGSEADLPFDISQSAVVRRVRIPGPPDVHAAVVALDDSASDTAVVRLALGSVTPADAVLTAAVDMPSISVTGAPPRELQVALRLVAHIHPDPVLEVARAVFTDPLASSVLSDPSHLDEVQRAWDDWLVDPTGSRWAAHLHESRAELIDMFTTGRLKPSTLGDIEVPPWATVGVAHRSPADRAEALLEVPPSSPESLDEWVRAAQWWGEVRSALALVNPANDDLDAKAWGWWADADSAFLAWLRTSYGTQLTRAWANWPASLDKVQPFLAKHRGSGGRLLLVVLDGMGFTQWARIRELAPIRVAQAGGVLAMLPTLTEVSRQAIAAGALPNSFAGSLRSTSKEPQHWTSAWSSDGAVATWVRIDGARLDELTAVPFADVDVIGLVLSATDELMHSAELLGDIGLHAGLEAWVRSGVLNEVLTRASDHGYDTWLTADHGNLAVTPSKEPREGAFVERAGTRARRYGSKTLRDGAVAEGVAWDAMPGYPSDESERLLFAPGRTGWGPSRLSHGGLSLDEVIVPLVQIEPAS